MRYRTATLRERFFPRADSLDASLRPTERRIRAEVAGAVEMVWLRMAAVEQCRHEVGPVRDDLNRIVKVTYEEGEVGILELLVMTNAPRCRGATDRLRRTHCAASCFERINRVGSSGDVWQDCAP